MAVIRKYECSVCKKESKKEDLTVKKAGFFEMGVGGRAIRSRVVGHLCPNCLVQDPDYLRPAFSSGPRIEMKPQ